MCARCEGPRHKSRNGGTLGTISQLALDPLCKQEIDKLASTRQHSIHSTVWQIDQCIPMQVTFVFLFMHGTTWHSRHLFSSSKTKLIKIIVSCKNTRKTETNVLGKNVLGKKMCSFHGASWKDARFPKMCIKNRVGTSFSVPKGGPGICIFVCVLIYVYLYLHHYIWLYIYNYI